MAKFHFLVKKTPIPLEWVDMTSYAYWKINDSLGGWDDDNSRWVAANENIDLSPIGTWADGYRATGIRITHTSNAPLPDLRLYDTEDNLIASYDGVSKNDPEDIPITFQGYDIGRLVIVSNNSATFRVKPIEFLTNSTLYVPDYDMEWHMFEKSVDMVIDSTNPLQAYKDVDVGSVGRTVLAEVGYITGRWYFEVRMHAEGAALTNSSVGIRMRQNAGTPLDYERSIGSSGSTGAAYWAQGRFYYNGSLVTSNPASWGVSNRWVTIGVAVDMTNGYAWFSKDGVWQGASGDNPDPSTGTDPAVTGLVGTFYPAAALFYQTNTYFSEAIIDATAASIQNLPSGFSAWDQTVQS